LTAGAGGTIHYNSSTVIGNIAASSFWLKCSVGTVAAILTIEGTGGGASTDEDITITTEWKEFKTVADTAAFTTNLRTRLEITPATKVIYVFGTGLYDDRSVAPTIPNPIASASEDRRREKFTILSANTKLTKLRGTISMWVKPYFDPTSSLSLVGMFYEGGDSAGAFADLHLRFFYNGTAGDRMALQVHRDNGATAAINHTPAVATGLVQDTWGKVVATWDATIANGGHIYVNGMELGSGSTNSAFNVSELGDTIAIGAELDLQSAFFGEIDELFIDDRIWPAEEVLANFNLPNGLPRTLI